MWTAQPVQEGLGEPPIEIIREVQHGSVILLGKSRQNSRALEEGVDCGLGETQPLQ